MLNRTPVIALAVSFVLVALPLSAQPTRDPGETPLGARGFEWQTEQQLAKEALAQLEAKLEGLDEEGWKREALAWIAFDNTDSGKMAVDDSFRVGDLSGKKADIALIDDEPMIWEISYSKKLPKELQLTLTDQNKTEVQCDLGAASKMSSGHLGVFMHEGVLHCLSRQAGAS